MNVEWKTTVLDDGRILILKVVVRPEFVRTELMAVLEELSRAPTKGFRRGRVTESAARQIHGRRALNAVREAIVERSFSVAVSAAVERHGFDPSKAKPPASSAISFSEQDGLAYEVIVTGLEPRVASGTIVNLQAPSPKKETDHAH